MRIVDARSYVLGFLCDVWVFGEGCVGWDGYIRLQSPRLKKSCCVVLCLFLASHIDADVVSM